MWAQTKLPCPDQEGCGSSDAYHVDTSGAGYCFSCEKSFGDSSGAQEVSLSEEEATRVTELEVGGVHQAIPERKLSEDTCAFFDVKTTDRGWIFPYHNEKGELIAQKKRFKDEKSFPWKGDNKKATLFGMHKFVSGNSITIVEGEFDALAYRDLMGDYPVISVKDGAGSAVKGIKKHLEYFKGFNKVILCFDNDEQGNKASIEVAELFPIGKVKIVNMRHHKDPNEYLMNGKYSEFKSCWWNAKEYTPAGIESAAEGGFESLFDDVDSLELFPYPFEELNETTFGIRKGEMVTIVSGSGVGKSAMVAETAYKLLMDTDKKIGCVFLEEGVKKTKLKFMSLFLDKPLHLTLLGRVAEKFDFLKNVLNRIFSGNEGDWKWTPEVKKELGRAWEKVIEKKAHDGEQQLWLFNHFGSNSIDSIVNKIDAMVTGLGCEFIFLDHVSIVVSDQQNADERKSLDELATKLRTLVEHRNFSLIIVSHLRRPGGKPHEEGGETSLADIRGTAGIGQLSDIVIGLERNGQHDDEYIRNVTKIRVLKNRFSGLTGLTSYAHYDLTTGRLNEVDPEDVKRIEEGVTEDGYINGDDPFSDPIEEDKSVFDSSQFGNGMEAEQKGSKVKW